MQWSVPWLDHLRQDMRYAIRGLRRSPGFTATVVVTLGLGIGANAAMFNVVDHLMFRPHAFLREPESVHRVYLRLPGQARLLTRESMPYSRYLDLKRWTTSFSAWAAFFPTTVAVGTGESTREHPIVAVTASFFDFFEARPVHGRFFVAAEDTTPTGASVAVLSFAFWNNELGGRDVIGEPILVDNILYTIIGIAPEGFSGITDGSPPAVFVPMTTFGANQPGRSSVRYWVNYTWDWAEVIARRKPDVTIARANADLTQAYIRSRDAARALHASLPRADPAPPIAIAGALKTGAGPYPGLEARTLVWVTGVAIVVLLIACANVANLLLARTLRRRREIALRLALGVTRGRLAGQVLTESLVLSLLGCIAGVGFAQWGAATLRRLVVPDSPAFELVTDWRTLAVAAAFAIVAGTLTGLAPLLLASRDDLTDALKSGTREGTYQRSRLRGALLVAQAALSVVLLVGAGLFVRSLDQVSSVRVGYDVDPVLLVRWQRRGEQMDVVERAILRRRLLSIAQTIPGVERAAWASNVPLMGTSTMRLFTPGIDSVARLGRFTYQTAGPDYFTAMGTRILRGRGFTESDGPSAPGVVVVSAAMARVLWPNQEALGRCLRLGADTAPCSTVVGIAEDAVHDPLNDQPLRHYLPIDQLPTEGSALLVVRTAGKASLMAESVRRTLQAEMPGQQYVTVRPMSELLDARSRSWRLGATMFVAFGVLALIVAAVGLYGVIAYDVAQRKHELGVRFALGAQVTDILRLVVGRAMQLAALGVIVGCMVALLAGRWIQPLLFQQSARDPLIYGGVAAMMVVVALTASAVPALRASKVNPQGALRSE